MDRSWIDAARSYNSMSEQERYAYWNRLTPEQQQALTEALATVASEAQPKAMAGASPVNSEPRRRGGTFAVGCMGFILGVVLTVAVEVAALAKGISALGGLVSTPTESAPPRDEPPPRPDQNDQTPDRDPNGDNDKLDCRNPKNAQRWECSQQRYKERKEEWESRHPGEEYPCEAPLTF